MNICRLDRLGFIGCFDSLEYLGNLSDDVGNVVVLVIVASVVNPVAVDVVDGSGILTDEKNTIAVDLDNTATVGQSHGNLGILGL